MKVNDKEVPFITKAKEYATYHGIDILVFCDMNLMTNTCTLKDINWLSYDYKFNKNTLSFFVNGTALVTFNYNKNNNTYFYYTAKCKLSIHRVEETEDDFIIDKFELETDECINPLYEKRVKVFGYNIPLDPDVYMNYDLDFDMKDPEHAPLTAYYYDKIDNTFKEFKLEKNKEKRTVLMVDIDPFTIELINKLDHKTYNYLNKKVSTMIVETINNIGYMTMEEEDED